MGNNVTIPEHIQDRFATSELESMEKLYNQISGHKKHFNKRQFIRAKLFKYDDVANAVYDLLDRYKENKVDKLKFFNGFSYLFKRSTKERLKFIFVMVNVSVSNGHNKITPKDLLNFLSFDIFQPPRIPLKTYQKELENEIHKIYHTYDLDRDRALNDAEFCNWAANSFEIPVLLGELQRVEKIALQTDAGISTPTSVIHHTHAAKTEGGGIAIDNLPPAWVSLFRAAKIRKKELEDPEIFEMLMTIISESLKEKDKNNRNNNSKSIQQSQRRPQQNPSRQPTNKNNNPNNKSNNNNNKNNKPPSTSSPPLNIKEEDDKTSNETKVNNEEELNSSYNDYFDDNNNNNNDDNINKDNTEDDSEEEEEELDDLEFDVNLLGKPPSPPRSPLVMEEDTHNVPIANDIPIPSPLIPAPPPLSNPSLPTVVNNPLPVQPIANHSSVPPPPAPPVLSSVSPPPPPSISSPSSHENRPNLLDQIKKGTTLKKIEEDDVEKLSSKDKDDLTSALANAILNHRIKMKMAANGSDDEEEDDDGWD